MVQGAIDVMSPRARMRTWAVVRFGMSFWVTLALLALPILLVTALIGIAASSIKVAVVVAVAFTTGLGTVLWLQLGEHQRWERASMVNQTTLKVSYTGSECEDQRTVDVDESDESVKITITARSYASACSDVGFLHTVIVELDDPLGDRQLIDGSCRKVCVRALGAN